MSNDQSNLENTNAARLADYIRFKRYAAYTFLVASPILIALPPRKLDLNTVALASAFAVSANHLYKDRTGRSVSEAVQARFLQPKPAKTGPGFFEDLPSERAQEIQAKLRAAREAQIRDANGLVSEEMKEKLKARQQQERSLGERIWMGQETEGWKEKRLREEQKALDEGKGYGDLIMEHIWDVWNWGKTSTSSTGTDSTPDSTNTNRNEKDPERK
jgi:hypothetical protein